MIVVKAAEAVAMAMAMIRASELFPDRVVPLRQELRAPPLLLCRLLAGYGGGAASRRYSSVSENLSIAIAARFRAHSARSTMKP
jgi:hypothetical protein